MGHLKAGEVEYGQGKALLYYKLSDGPGDHTVGPGTVGEGPDGK